MMNDIFGQESSSSFFNTSIDIHEKYVHNVCCQIILFWCSTFLNVSFLQL